MTRARDVTQAMDVTSARDVTWVRDVTWARYVTWARDVTHQAVGEGRDVPGVAEGGAYYGAAGAHEGRGA